MKILPFAEYKKVPWKNGLGFTNEIAIFPESKSEPFLWRISSAEVKESSNFSSYLGYQRILMPLQGDGIQLFESGADKCFIDLNSFDSVEFSGSMDVFGKLKKDPLQDLNVFYKQGAVTCLFEKIELPKEREFKVSSQKWQFLFLAQGKLRCAEGIVSEWDSITSQGTVEEFALTALVSSVIIKIRFTSV